MSVFLICSVNKKMLGQKLRMLLQAFVPDLNKIRLFKIFIRIAE